MKKLIILLVSLSSFSVFAQKNKPKLVVGIVVDQMRHDFLQRFSNKYSDGGFKRLINNGFEARNTHYNYIPTYTAPGHASIYTGTTPKYHGIIGNSWYNRDLERSVYCVGDTLAYNIGGSKNAGNISPRNLIAHTITDELKLSTNFRSKVIGVSLKDRGAVLPAGHTSDGAYWYDGRTGEFMTSNYYMDESPDWVNAFNERKLVNKYSDQVWETLLPIEKYVESTEDNSPYERGFNGKKTPTFPYDLKKLRLTNGPYGLIKTTPFGNSLVLDFGKAAIEGENMGADEITDFLCISFSSPDHIGHNFGPNSIEIEDTYLRLDLELAEFLNYLDEKIGKDNYLVFLTADHGVIEVPRFLTDHNLPGGFYDAGEIKTFLQSEITKKLGKEDWILNISNDQVFLNRPLIASSGKSLPKVQKLVADILLQAEPVLETITAAELQHSDYTDPLRIILQNGYNRKLSGDVLILKKPGYLAGSPNDKGTSHGSGYSYDTHVPFILYGTGIKNGSTVRKTTITDIAPTLAMLLNISMPNAAVTGEPIIELFD